MSAALLSRFDLVFILLDKPDEVLDKQVSEHIMSVSCPIWPLVINCMLMSESHVTHILFKVDVYGNTMFLS